MSALVELLVVIAAVLVGGLNLGRALRYYRETKVVATTFGYFMFGINIMSFIWMVILMIRALF